MLLRPSDDFFEILKRTTVDAVGQVDVPRPFLRVFFGLESDPVIGVPFENQIGQQKGNPDLVRVR